MSKDLKINRVKPLKGRIAVFAAWGILNEGMGTVHEVAKDSVFKVGQMVCFTHYESKIMTENGLCFVCQETAIEAILE